jgi:PIN domain nuclease of toxin-antitoxin system
MTALLDTHTLLWTALGEPKLGLQAQQFLRDSSSKLFVSAATAWEIATKVRSGKMPEAIAFEANFVKDVIMAGFALLPVTVEHALLAGRLPGPHRDPFDRMIAAQALALDIPVISKDEHLDAFGIRRIW